MALSDFKKDCVNYARVLGDYQSISVTDLANNYCKAIDENNSRNKNCYLSALVLRFWYTLDKLYKSSLTLGLEREDFIDWLFEAIDYAAKYRAWQDPKKHTNAQACINQCINTIRLQHFYQANLDKHRAVYNNISLDAPLLDGSDENDTLSDIISAEETNDYSSDTAYIMIQDYLDNNKVVEAIILDNIAYKDVFKYKKKTIKSTNKDGEPIKYTQHSSEFWPFKLVQELGTLDDTYVEYFIEKYNISPEKFKAAFDCIKKSNNQKKYRILRDTLDYAKSNYAY